MAIQPYKTPELYKTIDSSKSYVKEVSSYGSENTITSIEWYHLHKDTGSYNENLRHLHSTIGSTFKKFSDKQFYPIWEQMCNFRSDDVIIGTIPQSSFTGSIDAQTISITIPSGTLLTTTLYGCTFDSVDHLSAPYEGQDETVLPHIGPVAFLFDDNTNRPYTGSVNGGSRNVNSALTSWSGHPVAIPFFRGDNGHDTPNGYMLLDKGIIVINNSTLITSIQTAMDTAGRVTSSDGSRRRVIFTGDSNITYRPKTKTIQQIYFCNVEPNEFNVTFNESYNKNKAFYKPTIADPLWITEIALLNDDDEIIAIGKTSEPIRKDRFEPLVFSVILSV